jgi:hypothetical protein
MRSFLCGGYSCGVSVLVLANAFAGDLEARLSYSGGALLMDEFFTNEERQLALDFKQAEIVAGLLRDRGAPL